MGGLHYSHEESVITTSSAGPKTYPLVGSVPELLKDPFAYFFSAQREFGDVFRYRIGPRPLYFIAHPGDIKHVLLDNYKNYRKHSAYDKIKPLVGGGLLTSEGETWLANRRLAQPVFHRQRVAAFGQLMTDETESMLNRWERFEADEPFDVAAEMMRLTLTVVGKALFSTDLSREAREIGEALSFALEETNRRNLAPFSLPPSLPTPNNVRYKKAIGALDDVVYGLIEERRRTSKEGGKDEGDLLSMLLAAQDADTGERMSDKQLRDEAMTLFLAGHETSATALSWMFYLLSKHPAVTHALLEEVDQTLEGRVATVADVPELPYTRQVVDEALRLYPPAWMIGRHTLAEDRLPSGAVLDADTDVSISTYVTHRHPDFWTNPEGFDPERFAPERPERHRFAYFPFGAGPRICIGNNFALLEMVLTLVTVSQRCTLELVGGERGKMEPKITLRPKEGIKVRLRKR